MTESTSTRNTTGASPMSSPRLPSPPPLPELQLGPRSPSLTSATGEFSLDTTKQQDEGAARRIRPGTEAADMARGPPFVPLHQLESPFQLQEYLKSSYIKLTRSENLATVKPITKESALHLATPPTQQDTGEPVDKALWLYELCRFLVQQSNRLLVAFFNDSPPCSSQTCPEMRASEWQYLCAVHEPPKSCCAIDYCCHTLDWAGNILTSTKHFPSRLSLGGEGTNVFQSMKQLTNIFRRVYRIFAHAWFQHREVFWSLEQQEGLYVFFKTVCDVYQLIQEDNYTIPPEAEGSRDEVEESPAATNAPTMQILQNDSQQPSAAADPTESDPEASSITTTGATTRRHRHTPSTGTHVTIIAEGNEDEDDESRTTRLSQEVVSAPEATSTEQHESEPTSVPIAGQGATDDVALKLGRLVMPPTQPEIRVAEEPTPTPEQHGSDPFAYQAEGSNRSSRTAAAVEISTTEIEDGETSSSMATQQAPALNTSTSPTKTKKSEDDLVKSPGGGSVRSVDGDILSGILAHEESRDDDDERMEEIKLPAAETSSVDTGTDTDTNTNEDTTSRTLPEQGAERAEPETEQSPDLSKPLVDSTTPVTTTSASADKSSSSPKKTKDDD